MTVSKNAKGAISKRRNHTVPKALLKRWRVENGGHQGHWVLDCDTGAVSFHLGKEASFAIRDYCYVPVRSTPGGGAHRDESLEDWFSVGESALANTTDVILRGGGRMKQCDFDQLLAAAILLGYRSAYEYQMMEKAIRTASPQASADEVGSLTVDHFRNLYRLKLAEFSDWSFSIFHGFPAPLVVCDRPLFDMTLHRSATQTVLIPLGPDWLLVGSPRKAGEALRDGISSYPATEKLMEMANRFTVERARHFVVGTREQLLHIASQNFSGEQFAKRKAADSLVLTVEGVQRLRTRVDTL